MQVSRKQMLGIVLSLNSSERGSSQHHVRLALYLHAKRQLTVTKLTPWFPCSECPFPQSFHLRMSACRSSGYGNRASLIEVWCQHIQLSQDKVDLYSSLKVINRDIKLMKIFLLLNSSQ